MNRFIIRLLINALALGIAAQVVPGIAYDGWQSVIIVAFIFGLVNAIIRPILTPVSYTHLTLPTSDLV